MVKISELMQCFDKTTMYESSKIVFEGVDGYDVYNITAPFDDEGIQVIAGRVEKRDSEHSKVMFFKRVSDSVYSLLESYPTFELQDPYIAFINNELVLGGTEIFDDPLDPSKLSYRAIKLKGKNVAGLVKFFEGPDRMKDIRLLELADKKILCLTRPQGDYGGRGQIGYLVVDSYEQLTKTAISTAPLLNLFIDEEWGGANELYLLDENTVGVLGHIARFDEQGNRHYHAISFKLNINDFSTSEIKLILTRDLLQPGESKRDDLVDVIFSGGLKNLDNIYCELYVGVSDAEAHVAKIKNPFMEVEV